jgi:hypothetical protein
LTLLAFSALLGEESSFGLVGMPGCGHFWQGETALGDSLFHLLTSCLSWCCLVVTEYVSVVFEFGLFAVLVAARATATSRQFLLVIVPTAVVGLVVLALGQALPFLPELYGSLGNFQKVLLFHVLSVGVLWTVLDFVGQVRNRGLRPVLAFLVLCVPCLLVIRGYSFPYHFMAEQFVFSLVVVLGCTLAALTAGGRVAGGLLLLLVFAWNVVLMTVLWPVAWVFLMVFVYHAPIYAFLGILQSLFVAVFGGAGLSLILLPFLLLSLRNRFFRVRWLALFGRQQARRPASSASEAGAE